MTLLVIDIGNSRIKWGFHGDGQWLSFGALPRADAHRLASVWAEQPVPLRALGCNVADVDSMGQIEQALRASGLPIQWVRSQASQCGLVNGYDDPAQLGADRWVGMLAARNRVQGQGKSCVVLSAGTAVTIDAVTAAGEFIGGVILPGAAIMAEALERGTAALKRRPGHFRLPPTNTADAIATGTFMAVAGALRRMQDVLKHRDDSDCEIFITGGGATDLQATLDCPSTLIPNLVLEGLLVIAAQQPALP